jgi:hypothetical protein
LLLCIAITKLVTAPQSHQELRFLSVLEGARNRLLILRCSAPCTRPRARVATRSRSLPDLSSCDDRLFNSRLRAHVVLEAVPVRDFSFDLHGRTHYTQGLRSKHLAMFSSLPTPRSISLSSVSRRRVCDLPPCGRRCFLDLAILKTPFHREQQWSFLLRRSSPPTAPS